MEELDLNELINEYNKYIPQREVEYFKKNGSLDHKKRVVEKLKKAFKNVSTSGRGKKLIFFIGAPIEGAVVDLRQVATTDTAVLKVAYNANLSITQDMIGEHFTAKRWLTKFGVRLPFISKDEFFKKYNNHSNYGSEIDTKFEAGVNINNYTKPDIHEVLNSELAQKKIVYVIDRFYGRFFDSVVKHSKLKFKKVYIGNFEHEEITADGNKKWGINKSNKLTEWATGKVEYFIKQNRDKYKTLVELYNSKEFKQYIREDLNIISLWTEYELVEADTDTKVEIDNQAEVNLLVSKMVIKSMTNQEISNDVKINKIPYEFAKRFYISTLDNETKTLWNMGGETLFKFDNEKDGMLYRLIRDRVLTKSVATILEEMNDVEIDMAYYEERCEEYEIKLNEILNNQDKLNKLIEEYERNKKGIGD
ncbi:hypothetical protein [Liquorilactobacillus mali]|uniref:Uncharacterized protein n=1 Tax=Liquorilactobacillus mali TaxID=1618 RepID=A0A0R2FZE1_9LACO|nr:hypothetical protein [Liquorilactobacillus mali]KRN31621.1 hypothetical protein IV36_GL001744 [Liquorilactobacillus mali]